MVQAEEVAEVVAEEEEEGKITLDELDFFNLFFKFFIFVIL